MQSRITALIWTSQSGSMLYSQSGSRSATFTYAYVIYKGDKTDVLYQSTRDDHQPWEGCCCCTLHYICSCLNKWYCLLLCLLQPTLSTVFHIPFTGDKGQLHFKNFLVVPFLQENMKLGCEERKHETWLCCFCKK